MAPQTILKKGKRQLETFAKQLESIASMKKTVNAVNYLLPDADFHGNSRTATTDARELAILDAGVSSRTRSRPTTESDGDSTTEETSMSDSDRERPKRQKKEPSKSKQHVRYNMSKTPQFRVNESFISFMRLVTTAEEILQRRSLPLRKARITRRAKEDVENRPPETRVAQNRKVSSPWKDSPLTDSNIWVPSCRDEWFDCASEMHALCAEAALRSSLKACTSQSIKLASPTALSQEYIRDRLDIDDPLNGFQIRHREGGWLQGFCIWTTFTTWTRYFKWDSLHSKCGMIGFSKSKLGQLLDEHGTLSEELEAEPRAGDPLKSGVIWPTVAEIGLVGGLGCGEYLVRMAIDNITRDKNYKYIVLQATDTSVSFYERFGFTRVGAVCKYGSSTNAVGYRHWTFADEKNLAHHGGPSYMMALKIGRHSCPERILTSRPARGKPNFQIRKKSKSVLASSFLDAVAENIVEHKPTILAFSKQDSYFQPMSGPSVDEWMKLAGVQPTAIDTDHPRSKKRPREVVTKTSISSTNLLSEDAEFYVKRSRGRPPKCAFTQVKLFSEAFAKPHVLTFPTGEAREDILVTTGKHPEAQMSESDTYLRKQRFTNKDSPTCRMPFFFNKVVARRYGIRSRNSFFFVVRYNIDDQTMDLIKLEPCGHYTSGKRNGRIKWRAAGSKTQDFASLLHNVKCSGWDAVRAEMVSKTPFVHDESWDILDDVVEL